LCICGRSQQRYRKNSHQPDARTGSYVTGHVDSSSQEAGLFSPVHKYLIGNAGPPNCSVSACRSFLDDGLFVGEAHQFSIAKKDLAVHDNRVDVSAMGGKHQSAYRAIWHSDVGLLKVKNRNISLLADLQRANQMVDAERFRGIDRSHFKRALRGNQGGVVVNDVLDQSSEL